MRMAITGRQRTQAVVTFERLDTVETLVTVLSSKPGRGIATGTRGIVMGVTSLGITVVFANGFAQRYHAEDLARVN